MTDDVRRDASGDPDAGATDSSRAEPGSGPDWIEIFSTVLLAMATVATAWSGYQATRWSGLQSIAFSAANAARVESGKASTRAGQQVQIDVALFIQWVDAYVGGQDKLSRFYSRRFREEFRPALTAWLATKPETNRNAPLSPFDMPQYKLAEREKAEKLVLEAQQQTDLAKRNNQRSDNYVLCVVLFAASLFFAGISTKLTSRPQRAAILGLGYLLFLGTVIWLMTFPISISV